MPTLTALYSGELRCEARHVQSGNTLVTDAPTDNQGRGEAFSPTDLVCAALTTCMITTMGILAGREGINLTGLKAETTKIMQGNPRKIAQIQVRLIIPNLEATDAQKGMLKNAALTCPVALSLAETISQQVSFDF